MFISRLGQLRLPKQPVLAVYYGQRSSQAHFSGLLSDNELHVPNLLIYFFLAFIYIRVRSRQNIASKLKLIFNTLSSLIYTN